MTDVVLEIDRRGEKMAWYWWALIVVGLGVLSTVAKSVIPEARRYFRMKAM